MPERPSFVPATGASCAAAPPRARQRIETLCAWCPGFERRAQRGEVQSHGICGACRDAQLAAFTARPRVARTGPPCVA